LKSDIAVIGAGAAGLMAAISAARESVSNHPQVTLLDTRQKIGAKILISGGTRCNVTNRSVTPADYHGGPAHFIKHVLEAFTPEQTREFFEEIGVPLVLETTGKYFPATHSGKTVLEALMAEAARLGVVLKTGCRINLLEKRGECFDLKSDAFELPARRVILATGGLSYPETGSDGTGYALAKFLGHTLVPTAAALTPLLCHDEDWQSLSGIAVDSVLYYYENERKITQCSGALLCTHFGFSGPAALDISRFWSRGNAKNKPQIFANFAPQHNTETVKKMIDEQKEFYADRRVKKFVMEQFLIPERLAEVLLKKASIGKDQLFGRMTSLQKKALLNCLTNCRLEITGVYGYKKAEVTSGGIALEDVKVSTLESKKTPGLYFSGEIMDVDGRIGGFNFQWAWSSGAIAGRSAARSL
jgi:hypothetical protein